MPTDGSSGSGSGSGPGGGAGGTTTIKVPIDPETTEESTKSTIESKPK
jgi:hypothetical protein